MEDRTTILSLPAEILGEIGTGLDIEDYAHLRLTCKQVEDFTFPYFARQFFHRRKFFRGPISLNALLAISQSRLGPYLEHFILGTELLDREVPSTSSNLNKEAYALAFAEQTALLGCGWDREILSTVFNHLANLRTVEVENFDDREKYDWDSGQLVHTMKGGYGMQTLLDHVGFDRPRLPQQGQEAHQWVLCVHTLLSALARSTARPQKLKITAREVGTEYLHSDLMGVDDDAFKIPAFLRPLIVPVVENLQELDLDIRNRHIYLTVGECPAFRTRGLREFLGLPKTLRTLRIRQFENEDIGEAQTNTVPEDVDFWAWLAADPQQETSPSTEKDPASQESTTESDNNDDDDDDEEEETTTTTNRTTSTPTVRPPALAFAHLRELELGHVDISAELMEKMLKKVSPTLEVLRLSNVTLRKRPTYESDPDDDSMRTEVNLWIDLCNRLAEGDLCPRLREIHLNIGSLGSWHLQQWEVENGEWVFFKQLRITGDPGSGKAEFDYKGSKVKEALSDLAADLRAAVRDGRNVFKTDILQPISRRNSF